MFPRPSGRYTLLPDIEELCTLCEPLPDGSPVTTYPMRAEKKKAREELDIVNVIEWRKDRNADATNRWFLLVRRPEGGEYNRQSSEYRFNSLSLEHPEASQCRATPAHVRNRYV